MRLRILSLIKNDQYYVIRYQPGFEEEAMKEVMRLARDPDTDVDWLDAARLSLQITRQSAQHRVNLPMR